MRQIFLFIADQIDTWWDFLCNTQVPGCAFTFGALVIFFLLFDGAMVLLKIVLFNNPTNSGDIRETRNLLHRGRNK